MSSSQMPFRGVSDDEQRASGVRRRSGLTHCERNERRRSGGLPLTQANQEVGSNGGGDPFQNLLLQKPRQPGIQEMTGFKSPLPSELVSSEDQSDGDSDVIFVKESGVVQKRQGDQIDTGHLLKRQKLYHKVTSDHSHADRDVYFVKICSNVQKRKCDYQDHEGLLKRPKWCQEVGSQGADDPFQLPLQKPTKPEGEEPSCSAAPLPYILICSDSSDQSQKGSVAQKRKGDQQDDEHLHKKQKQHTAEQTDDEQPSTSNTSPTWHMIEGLPYLQGPMLGQGGFGSVFAGTRVYDGLKVAIKYISKDEVFDHVEMEGQGSVPLEVALMKRVDTDPACPNILRLVEWFEQPSHYLLILERPDPCQDLGRFCEDNGCFDESLAKKLMAQLINALKHCESQGVLHRDVKPPNILIRTDTHEIKLLDFGCGEFLKDSAYKMFMGTFDYAPPEWFSSREYHAKPATVWSVGVTLYEILCDEFPFSCRTDILKCKLFIPSYLSKGKIEQTCSQTVHKVTNTKPKPKPGSSVLFCIIKNKYYV